jgi:hypothetical protein
MKTETVTMQRDKLSVRLVREKDNEVSVLILSRNTGATMKVASGAYLDAHALAVRTRDALAGAGVDVGAGVWWED